MPNALVIGYGNPLRQDDGLGWRAAELVRESGAPAEIVVCHQLTPELLLRFESARIAIFLDAAIDQPPGEIRSRAVTAASAWSSPHHLTPDQLLGLAEQLGQPVCRSMLITGGVFEVGACERLTAQAEVCAREMARQAIDLCGSAAAVIEVLQCQASAAVEPCSTGA